jgi:hypothetical protein
MTNSKREGRLDEDRHHEMATHAFCDNRMYMRWSFEVDALFFYDQRPLVDLGVDRADVLAE